MKINRVKIKSEYRKELKDYHRDIDKLDSEDRGNGIEYAKMYYNYLAEAGIPYARLALDVIENEGKFGKLANIHLKSQSIFEGIQSEAMPSVREKIIISLASHDAKMRSDKDYDQSNPCYDKIEAYHLKVFKYHTSPYAWGGLSPKELIGSGSWMKFYEDDSGIFDGASEIIKADKVGKDGEYSAERMLKSIAHSYKQYILEKNTPFELMMSTASKEQAALIWKIDPARIELVEEDTSMQDSVSSKVFKARPAEYFAPSGDFDYSSSESESEDDLPQTLAANKAINEQLTRLLSNPSDLHEYQQESFNEAIKDLNFAEKLIPGITKSSLDSMNEYSEFMKQLTEIKDPVAELAKVKKIEEEQKKMEPDLQNLMQTFQKPGIFSFSTMTQPQTQEQSTINGDNDRLDQILSHTTSIMNNLENDFETQNFVKNLGGNSWFNYEDHGSN